MIILYNLILFEQCNQQYSLVYLLSIFNFIYYSPIFRSFLRPLSLPTWYFSITFDTLCCVPYCSMFKYGKIFFSLFPISATIYSDSATHHRKRDKMIKYHNSTFHSYYPLHAPHLFVEVALCNFFFIADQSWALQSIVTSPITSLQVQCHSF